MHQPFRLGLSVGTDICRVSRLFDLERPDFAKFNRFFRTILNPQEITQIARYQPWYDHRRTDYEGRENVLLLVKHLAGRWAAKEAAKKAWTAELIGFKELTVTRARGQPPVITVHVHKDDQTYSQDGILSISHDGDYATATVIAEPLQEDILLELQRRKDEAKEKLASMDPTDRSLGFRKIL